MIFKKNAWYIYEWLVEASEDESRAAFSFNEDEMRWWRPILVSVNRFNHFFVACPLKMQHTKFNAMWLTRNLSVDRHKNVTDVDVQNSSFTDEKKVMNRNEFIVAAATMTLIFIEPVNCEWRYVYNDAIQNFQKCSFIKNRRVIHNEAFRFGSTWMQQDSAVSPKISY